MTPPTPSAESAPARHGLTMRAFVAAAVLTAVAMFLMHFHDGNLVNWNLSSHNLLMPTALGLVFVLALAVNVLLALVGAPLRGAELAVVATLVLASTPLARYYSHNLVGTIGLTHGLVNTKARDVRQLQKANPYDLLPDRAMLDDHDSRQYLGKLTDETKLLADPAQIPWRVWIGPMLFWGPLMLSFLLFSACFAMTVYRQWAHRELVSFPLAEFVARLVETRDGGRLPDIFSQRLFWIGLGMMVVIFSANGLHGHVERMIEFPLKFMYYEVSRSFPFLANAREGYSLLRGTFYFTMIAVAVLLPSEISFTSWVTWPVMVFVTFLYYQQTGQRLSGPENTVFQHGAALAMAGLIIYGGRRFYWSLARRAVGLAATETVDNQSLWAARMLVISGLVLAVCLWRLGIPLDLVVLWMGWLVVMLLVVCRMAAEMGLVWMPLGSMSPLALQLAWMGAAAIGAKAYALMAIVNTMILPSNVTMVPLAAAFTNAIRIEDRVTRQTRAATLLPLFAIGALVVSAAILIWLGYSFQEPRDDWHAPRGINEVLSNDGASGRIVALAAGQDVATVMRTPTTFAQRWTSLSPIPGYTGFFACGFALVLLTGVARLRMPRFPLHPLPLLLLGSWVMSRFVFAFFIGWLIKTALLRIGGGKLFRQAQPLFVGIVIGQAVVTLLWVLINIAISLHNHMQIRSEWFLFMRDIYSS